MIKKIQLWIENIPLLAKIATFIYMGTVRKYINSKRNKAFKTEGKEALFALKSVFQELDSMYWLEFGTMLGAVREKDFISHDLDIDVGMFFDDYQEEQEKVFKKYGFKKTCMYLVDNGNFAREETYYYKNVGVDIFYFHRRENEIFCHTFAPIEGKSEDKTIEELGGLHIRELRYPYGDFADIDFLGGRFSIPANIDTHLRESYGERWMVKDPNYSNTMATNVTLIENKVGKRYLF
jgi:hypothetical protein